MRDEIARAYRAPTHKLAISATLAARLDALGFGPATDVGQAFDAAGFFPGPARPAGDPPVVLVVGPLEVEFKGIEIALRGLALARRRGVRFHLRRVSYSPCLDAERDLGVTDEYHDRIAPERMPFAYRASDAFVGASRVEEGFGLPSLEALSCGLPALLSDVPGQREIGGAAAAYFRDGEPESLADALPGAAHRAARERARTGGPRGGGAVRRGARGRAARDGLSRGRGGRVRDARGLRRSSSTTAAPARPRPASPRCARRSRARTSTGEIVLVDCASGARGGPRARRACARTPRSFLPTTAATRAASTRASSGRARRA